MADTSEVDFDSVVGNDDDDDSSATTAVAVAAAAAACGGNDDDVEMIGRHDEEDSVRLSLSTVVVVVDGLVAGKAASDESPLGSRVVATAGLSCLDYRGQSSTSSSPPLHQLPDAHSSGDEDSVIVVDASDGCRDSWASIREDMSNCGTPVQSGFRLATTAMEVVHRRDLRPSSGHLDSLVTCSVHARDASKDVSEDVSCANLMRSDVDNVSDDDAEKLSSSSSTSSLAAIDETESEGQDVSRNRRLPAVAEEMLADDDNAAVEEPPEDDDEDAGEDVIVLEPSGLIENDEETEEVLAVDDIAQPFSDEVDSLGSVDVADNDTRNGEEPPNCPAVVAAADDDGEDGVAALLMCDDGDMDDFVSGGPAAGSGGASSRSSNSSSSSSNSGGGDDVEIEDLVVDDDEIDLSPKSFKDKSMMKRKQFVDSRNHCLGKKRCFSNSLEGAVEPEETGSSDLSTPLPSVLVQIHALKKRIPTKDNPPPELAQWLTTFQCWSNAERLLAIDQMIDLCDPTQVRHMMSVIEPQFQRDFISLLPKELALCVLSFLEPKDLLRAAQTCKYWRILAEDNLLWREKCKEAGVDEMRRTKPSNVAPSPWKAAYMRQHDIEMNWRFRPIRSPKVLKGHDDHVITCLQFSGSRIVSGSDDNTLKVWSATTGKCLKTLVGHTGGVWSSQMAGSTIVSGSTDRTLKVWNADSGQCIHTLYGHTSTVRCMHLHGDRVVSGSRDSTLRLWDIGTGMCQHVLLGHCAAVRCVQYGPDGRLVVSGAYDYTVKVWNPEREECLHTLQGHTNRVYSLQFDGVHVVSGSLDTSIRVWDVESGACRHTLMGHQSLTSGMELKNNILVSGNADSTVKVWDIMTGQCLQTLSGPNKHNSAVTCLQFNSKFVITSSDDGTVKLWDLKTGEFVRNLVALESGGSGGVVWRIRASPTKLVCAVGSRNGTEETKLLVLDFDALTELQNSRIDVK